MTSLNSFVSFSTLNISTRKTNTACVNHLSRSSGQINAEEGKYYTSDMVEEYLDVSERVYLTVFFF